jgi:hypothetical protein
MKEAVTAAAGFVGELFPNAKDVRLEEIVAQGPVWHVVVSFTAQESTLSQMLSQPQRTFKQVEVQRDSGEPIALRVWKA